MEYVEDVRGYMFDKIIQRRDFRGIIIGGGSPCQGNTSLNRNRKGLQDPRSRQPEQLARIVRELESFPNCPPVLKWIENVASAPQQVQEEYLKIVGAKPLQVDAAIFGWVSRRRLGQWTKGGGSRTSSTQYCQ